MKNKQRGFTLTEIMVAVVIGLISTLIVFKALQSNNIIARNVGGGSDTLTVGVTILSMIEKHAATAGYGINDPLLASCVPNVSDITTNVPLSMRALVQNFNAVEVLQNDSNLYQIQFRRSGGEVVTPSRIAANMTSTAGTFSITNPFFYSPNDVVVLRPQNGNVCVVRRIVSTNNETLDVNAPLPQSFTALPVTFVYNLGSFPENDAARSAIPTDSRMAVHRYTLNRQTGELRYRDLALPTEAGCDTNNGCVIAENIADIYTDFVFTGTNSSGKIVLRSDESPVPLFDTATNRFVDQLSSLRMAVLVREPQPDFSNGNGCRNNPPTSEITPNTSPRLNTGWRNLVNNQDIRFNLNHVRLKDPFCYRYHIAKKFIPLQNMTWRPE